MAPRRALLMQSTKRRNMSSWDRIIKNRLKLRDEFNIDPNELRRSLSDKKVITIIEEQQIRGKQNPKEQYDELFTILLSKNPQECVPKFYEALTDIRRQDVRDFLQGMLMKRRNMSSWDRIIKNRLKLRDEFNIDPNELRRSLSDKKVITIIEEQQIRGKQNPKEQYDELFAILVSKNPQECVPKFYEALTDIGRQDVRDFFQDVNGGVVEVLSSDGPQQSLSQETGKAGTASDSRPEIVGRADENDCQGRPSTTDDTGQRDRRRVMEPSDGNPDDQVRQSEDLTQSSEETHSG
ncbi:unnamed protein product [Darwinula stevensoni]|uniref:CARD domain-containing protein n=1 Tax=Darwinula stevensoni TaxID=69355 RepID=A0A7R9FRG6_9CRUS|nr:unnamed protein product [Darwinula stevensoni]CAG0901620.1 unnamed protein product [Darwinula stevensoni]